MNLPSLPTSPSPQAAPIPAIVNLPAAAMYAVTTPDLQTMQLAWTPPPAPEKAKIGAFGQDLPEVERLPSSEFTAIAKMAIDHLRPKPVDTALILRCVDAFWHTTMGFQERCDLMELLKFMGINDVDPVRGSRRIMLDAVEEYLDELSKARGRVPEPASSLSPEGQQDMARIHHM